MPGRFESWGSCWRGNVRALAGATAPRNRIGQTSQQGWGNHQANEFNAEFQGISS
jgi:hypothetical protein